MGIHVCLSVLPNRIDDDVWARVYDETVKLLRAWPDPPLGATRRAIAGQTLWVYSKSFENERGWMIFGDARSRTCFESFEFPRALGGRVRRADRIGGRDALVEIARESGGGGSCSRVFGAKSQGRPYHGLLVAVATLVENRLPEVAVAHGDIDGREGERARAALDRIFGEAFALPVVVDEKRARIRLERELSRSEVDEFLERYRPSAQDSLIADVLSSMRRSGGRAGLLRELELTAPSATHANDLSAELREAVLDLGARLSGIARQLELGARLAAGLLGRGRLLADIAMGTEQRRLRLTEMAWNDVEACVEDELCLLWALVHVELSELGLHLLAHALFESRAARRLAMRSFVADG